jgi:hypothetical protein
LFFKEHHQEPEKTTHRRENRAEGVAQVAECLPKKFKLQYHQNLKKKKRESFASSISALIQNICRTLTTQL